MGIREAINKHPKTGISILAALILGGVVFAAVNLKSSMPERATKAFYTADDGKTWFVDSIDRIPPFDQGGKTAVRAEVFVCSNDGKQFVGYMERYSADFKKRLDESAAAVAAGRPASLTRNSAEVAMRGTEVKRPGDPNWVSGTDLIGKNKVTRVSCPSGGMIDSVEP